MIQKLLIIVCIVLVIACGILALVSHSRGQTVDTLTAEVALNKRLLLESQADLRVSTENHARMMAENEKLLTSMLAQADEEREAAVKTAEVSRDVENAPDSDQCAKSAPIRAMLRGLYTHPAAGRSSNAVDPVSKPGSARQAVELP